MTSFDVPGFTGGSSSLVGDRAGASGSKNNSFVFGHRQKSDHLYLIGGALLAGVGLYILYKKWK